MQPEDVEFEAVMELEKQCPIEMGTIDAVRFCKNRFNVPCNEATFVKMHIVYRGLVSKEDIRKYVIWYKNNNLTKFTKIYPFTYVDETNYLHKEGYTPRKKN